MLPERAQHSDFTGPRGGPGTGPPQGQLHGQEPPAIDLTECGPPPEVLEQMAHADAINARLRASGRELAFELSGDGCSLRIELRDSAGKLLRILSAEEAVEIAAGGDVE